MENSKSWRWWDDVLVRGAGFGAGGVLRLASTSLAAQADRMGSTPFSEADLSDYRASFAKVSVELSRELQDIARQDDFLRAVSWQNHRLLDGAVRPFCEWDPATQTRHSKHRQREELIANYWQRYCVKNDTIGFFGPSGWGTFSDDSATRYTPGETLIERREVFFESWAIDCLAESFEALPAIREWLKPRRLTFVKIEGDINFNGPGLKVKLPALETAVLSMCDGKTSVHDIERELSGSYSVSLMDILGILDTLKAKRWIVLKIELPAGAHPEICLRQFLLGIGDTQLQSLLLARLDAIEAARDKIESSGDATELTQALSELDALFSGFTETSSTRNEGRTYGGRTLVYHDSRRNMALSVGEDIKQGLAPLYLLAKSARWICWRLGTEVRQLLRQTYQRCVEKHGAQFDLTTMWLESLGPLSKVIDAALDNIDQVFRAKWAKIIAVEDSERRVEFTYAQLEERVNQEFDAPGAGWEGARYFCPDVMLSAVDINDLKSGDFKLVLGEIHLTINTMRSSCFVTQHPDKSALLKEVDKDFPKPQLLNVLPKESPPRLSVRTHPVLSRDCDYMIELNYHTVDAGRDRLVKSRDTTILEEDGLIKIRIPNGETFDLVDVYAELLMGRVIDKFQLFSDRAHMPRVSIDKLVIARESWRFQAQDLEFANEKDEALRFMKARSWWKSQNIPRFVFVKSKTTEKPFYVDFESPIFINILSKLIRRNQTSEAIKNKEVTFVEMLPDHQDLWLNDHAGNKYTSELRFTWVDNYPIK